MKTPRGRRRRAFFLFAASSGEERLLAPGAVADGGDAGAALLGDEVQEILGGGREGGETVDARERLAPAWQGGVHLLAFGEGVQRCVGQQFHCPA